MKTRIKFHIFMNMWALFLYPIHFLLFQEPVEIDLANYTSAAELESFGLDALKAALITRGMKCGGSLTDRAERLFAVKGLTKEEIPPALLSKGGKIKGKGKK